MSVAEYDFNKAFAPLHVYDQGAVESCFYFANPLCVAAKVVQHGGREPIWSGTPSVGYSGQAWQVTGNGETHTINQSDAVVAQDHEAVKTALARDGVLLVAIEMPDSISVFDAPSLPVINVKAGDKHQSAHSLVAVGYTADGVIVQSSWGTRWGFHGRAILGWDWWDTFVPNGGCQHVLVDGFPANDMPDPLPTPPPPVIPTPVPAPVIPTPVPAPTPTPAPARKVSPLLLIRRPGSSNVYAVTGGLRSWIYSRAILAPQGASMSDVVEKPVSDPLWHIPLIGNKPPNGDV